LIQAFSPLWFAARSFKRERIAYYEYLADLLADSDGKRNLIDMFKADAQRYAGRPRGALAAYWVEKYEESGADLVAAWTGTVPESDLMVIRVAQTSGGAALEQALRDVARVSGLIDKAKSEFVSTITAGLMGVALAVGVLAALPLALVPKMKEAFGFVPIDKWGPLGQRLLGLSADVEAYGLPVLGVLIALVWVVAWSLPNLIGPFRSWLDEHVLIYKLYRDFRGALCLATASSMVKRRAGVAGMRLQDALEQIAKAAEPWLRWHCERIVENIEQSGGNGPEVFDTGLLEKETFFYLADMVETHGFDTGLQKAGGRTERKAGQVVAKRAEVIRWMLLGLGLVSVMGVAGLAMGVIYEMKTVIMSVAT